MTTMLTAETPTTMEGAIAASLLRGKLNQALTLFQGSDCHYDDVENTVRESLDGEDCYARDRVLVDLATFRELISR